MQAVAVFANVWGGKKAADLTMAQTGSAQREPSMEEILASIRRIIEDSDAVRTPEDEGVPEHMEVAPPSAVSATLLHPTNDEPEVVAFRSGLEDLEPADQSQQPFQPSAVEQGASGANDAAGEPAEELYRQPAEVQPLEPVTYASPLDEEAATTFTREDDQRVQAAPAPQVTEPHHDLSEDGKLSLISEQAGRQVAAAFGELSEVFAASRRRSFDEMAEEMLRPMLQDWLDNNLPTLVEKLVREEIERVARGG